MAEFLAVLIFCTAFALIVSFVVVRRARRDSFVFPKSRTNVIKKGEHGERIVATILGGTIEGRQYLINDIIIDYNGDTSQIDHIFINKYGVWAIETKSWGGKIYGDKNGKQWTQVLAYGNEKHYPQNPIKQNETHVYRLLRILGKRIPVFNVVVFTEADIDDIRELEVCDIDTLRKKVWTDQGYSLSDAQMRKYYQQLLEIQEKNANLKDEHIDKIKMREMLVEANRCPYCGCKLVVRTGKNGDFYACPNYPNCKFTKNID
jgi:hypothetical protein